MVLPCCIEIHHQTALDIALWSSRSAPQLYEARGSLRKMNQGCGDGNRGLHKLSRFPLELLHQSNLDSSPKFTPQQNLGLVFSFGFVKMRKLCRNKIFDAFEKCLTLVTILWWHEYGRHLRQWIWHWQSEGKPKKIRLWSPKCLSQAASWVDGVCEGTFCHPWPGWQLKMDPWRWCPFACTALQIVNSQTKTHSLDG